MAFPNLPYKGNQIPNQPFSYPEVPATFDRLFGARVPNIQLDPNPSDIIPVPPFANQWIRPEDWLPMPTVTDTEEKFVGLFAVYNSPENYLAIQCSGDYTVDWGDGSTENFNSGDKAQHSYDWATVSEATLTTRGYKQVLVTVTANGESNLTALSLAVRHDNVSGDYSSTPWLDVLMSLPNAGTSDSIILDGTYHIPSETSLQNVERVQIINSGAATDFYGLMYYGSSLQEFVLGKSVVEDVNNMFSNCYNLKTVKFKNLTTLDFVYDAVQSSPYYRSSNLNLYLENISEVTDLSYYFKSMDILGNVFINGMPDLVDMSNIFDSCEYLESAFISNVPLVTSMSEAFEYCYSLKNVVIGNCPALEDIAYMFYDCEWLESVEFGSTPSLQYTYGMFEYCYSLLEAPTLDMTYVEDTESMFYDCQAIRKIPNYSTPALTNAYTMFAYCYSLEKGPELNLEGVTDLSSLYSECVALAEVPSYDIADCSDLTDAFSDCSVLQSVPLTNISTDLYLSYCLLGRDAIVDVFNGLSTITPGEYFINIENNYGVDDLSEGDVAIATDKGWTVYY